MAFRIVKDATAWWPVFFDQAGEDGRVVTQTIDLRFVRMGVAEFNRLYDTDAGTSARVLWDRVVRGWRGVEDEAGEPLAMTPDAVDALLDQANFPEGFGIAYAKFFRAMAETRLGNSEASPAAGPAAVAAAAPTQPDAPN